MPDSDQLRALLHVGREERFLEYKQSGQWNDLKAKIVKTALGMANIRGGGTIVVGVSERGGRFEPDGMSAEHWPTFKADTIRDNIHEYADPYVQTELYQFDENGKVFLAIIVHEFDEIPVICKKDGADVDRGRIYTRPSGKPATSEVPSQTEMREIIDAATEKSVRKFLERMERAGVPIKMSVLESDAEKLRKQREGL